MLFLDTANLELISDAKQCGLLDGVTTNPTLVSREISTFKDYHALIREICELMDGPVSAEVIRTDTKSIMEEARQLAAVHRHVMVKVPVTQEGITAISMLSQEGIRIHATVLFSPAQALLAAKAGATFVSPFAGRLDELGQEGIDVVRQIRRIYQNYGYSTKVMVAGVRHARHVIQAALAGAEAVTVSHEVFQALFHHPLTDRAVERFLADWSRIQS